MSTPIIDTHLHLIDQDRLHYPWLRDVPALNRSFSLQEYWSEAEPLGIAAALHMEVDVVEEDREAESDFVLGLGAPVVGAIASAQPEDPSFAAQLERIAAKPGIRGIRRILHTLPDELGRRPIFTENLRRLARHDLSFDLCVLARQLPIAAEIARACPEIRFVLDHCGVPAVEARALSSWGEDIRRVAELPNVACKISGVVAYAGNAWTTEDLRPFVEHCIESFGWDRVVWGSDWPVCTLTADLTRWVQASRDLTSECSESETARLFNGNARRIYRLS
ncbi:MAG TPA: amidohydrolase [Acidisoma sp.]|jgi:predicted TIM-barrel fold metal-dependent hydrolase|nr:amidohydrolase [Acidisoma sp.]